jgi:hypothetical protein
VFTDGLFTTGNWFRKNTGGNGREKTSFPEMTERGSIGYVSIGSFVYGAELNGSEGYLLDCRLVFGQAVVRKMKCGKCERESLTCS